MASDDDGPPRPSPGSIHDGGMDATHVTVPAEDKPKDLAILVDWLRSVLGISGHADR